MVGVRTVYRSQLRNICTSEDNRRLRQLSIGNCIHTAVLTDILIERSDLDSVEKEDINHALPDATVHVCDRCLHVHYALFQPAFDFYVVNYDLLCAGRYSANKSNVRLSDLALAIKEQRFKACEKDYKYQGRSSF